MPIMRKDVRIGFAVGGVLLAVIIVAVLVIHRNKNNGGSVAFDPGKGTAAAAVDQGPADGTPKTGDAAAEPVAPAQPGSGAARSDHNEPSAGAVATKATADD